MKKLVPTYRDKVEEIVHFQLNLSVCFVAGINAEFQQPSINFWHLIATEDLFEFISNSLLCYGRGSKIGHSSIKINQEIRLDFNTRILSHSDGAKHCNEGPAEGDH